MHSTRALPHPIRRADEQVRVTGTRRTLRMPGRRQVCSGAKGERQPRCCYRACCFCYSIGLLLTHMWLLAPLLLHVLLLCSLTTVSGIRCLCCCCMCKFSSYLCCCPYGQSSCCCVCFSFWWDLRAVPASGSLIDVLSLFPSGRSFSRSFVFRLRCHELPLLLTQSLWSYTSTLQPTSVPLREAENPKG